MVSKYHSPIKAAELLGRKADSGLGLGKLKMNLEHFVIAESKAVLETTKGWGHVKGHISQLERTPSGQGWKTLSSKVNNVVLDYNSECKIYIPESTVT